jgi:hypothetical protein
MNSNANEKYNPAGERPLGAAKPVDPATRLSELLAQSLEELTRPFDPPRVDPLSRAPQPPVSPPRPANDAVELPPPQLHAEPTDPAHPVESRIDADRALAELEAELFANRPVAAQPQQTPEAEPPPLPEAAEPPSAADDAARPHAPAGLEAVAAALDAPPPLAAATPFDVVPARENDVAAPPLAPDPAAADVIARVRRIMVATLAVTFIAVGSLAGFIGYRLYKGEGSTAKTADKITPGTTIPTDITLSLPNGARVVQSAVAEDRLVITLDIGGKTEVRTFDLRTLQPAGRLTFSGTP